MALIITLEGVDGSGKSTLLKNVKDNFVSNKNIIFIHTPIVPFNNIRHVLTGDNYDNFMFYQASNSYLSKQMRNSDKIYIVDRFSYSTYIVHSFNKDQKNHIEDSFRFLNLIVPQMMFLVKADFNICKERISKREIISDADKIDTKSFKNLYDITYTPYNIKIKDLLFHEVQIIKNNNKSELRENVDKISSYINSILQIRL